ncbi:thioredoxin fold domain-containing protein [Oceanihabitans sp. 2_MG-2023]|uniref:thioredoxin family protein n=1 Tax=Oceanihabitans sp. 2_MG-2023 TaxID=3062661 RepID=UPI0026E2866D|nr:thioredoxin fold domain-containing protein [Oceanihabitans sp. 2_MG-2023]MDO6595345.1 thioredoxin fold domain-containing protein [Oceanihabitans sp. 2_MG-2023]
MKNLALTLLIAVFTIGSVAAQEINWVTFEQALELQKKKPKKIMIDMYTEWCGPCKMLDKNTFQNKEVAAYVNENFYAVKFNAEGNAVANYKGKEYTNPNYDPAKAKRRNSAHQLARFFQVNAYPTIVYLDEKAEVIAPIKGYQKPDQIELYLKMFANDDYKELTTQDAFNEYYLAFKPTFKG